jgi:hypothetical protein
VRDWRLSFAVPTALQISAALADFDAEVCAIAPAEAFGLVAPTDNERFVLHTRGRWGTAVYALEVSELPRPLRTLPKSAAQFLPLRSHLDADRPIDLLWRQLGLNHLIVLPLADSSFFWSVSQSTHPLTEEQLPGFWPPNRRFARPHQCGTLYLL